MKLTERWAGWGWGLSGCEGSVGIWGSGRAGWGGWGGPEAARGEAGGHPLACWLSQQERRHGRSAAGCCGWRLSCAPAARHSASLPCCLPACRLQMEERLAEAYATVKEMLGRNREALEK